MEIEKKNQNLVTVKKEYLPPKIEINWIEMEQGIAASSATVNTGTAGAPNTPSVEDWTSQDISTTNQDF